jgi:hypothetical protein
MPDKQISNPAGLWGVAGDSNAQIVNYVNNSGGALVTGDVVVFATDVTGAAVTTTTTVNDKTVVGVVGGTQGTSYPAGASVPVVVRGVARVNVGANAPAAGDLLTTAAVAKTANTNAGTPAANAVTGSIIGVARAATKDAANTLVAEITKF